MYKIYQIEYGDTLDTIARKSNSTVDDIKKINGITDDSFLSVGSLIIIPNDNIFTTYIVNPQDTVYSISKMYNIDPKTLLMLNGLNPDDYIYPNQEIIVPNENTTVYITENGDTIGTVLNSLNIDIETLMQNNNKIYLLEDQLMVYKKDK